MSRNWTWGGLCVTLLRPSVLGLARPGSLAHPAAELETPIQQREMMPAEVDGMLPRKGGTGPSRHTLQCSLRPGGLQVRKALS